MNDMRARRPNPPRVRRETGAAGHAPIPTNLDARSARADENPCPDIPATIG
jgi:hypothetical protein